MSLLGNLASLVGKAAEFSPLGALGIKLPFENMLGKAVATVAKEVVKSEEKKEAASQQPLDMEQFLAYMQSTQQNNCSSRGNWSDWG